MLNDHTFAPATHDWQPCRVVIPRAGLMLDRYGVRRRLIWPGRYLVRHSRTFGHKLYRIDNS